jgi:hypothetical protein
MLFDRLRPQREYTYVRHHPAGLTQEGALALIALDEGDLAVRPGHGNYKPRKTSATAYICDPERASRELRSQQKGFSVMTRLGVSEGSPRDEVELRVPAAEQFIVFAQLWISVEWRGH